MIPARTETVAFSRYVWGKASGLLFVRKRLRFFKADGLPGTSPVHPSVLIAYSPADAERLRTSRIGGAFVVTQRR